MKILRILTVAVVGVSSISLQRNARLRKLSEVAMHILGHGPFTRLNSAYIRWPDMAANGRENGRGRFAPYLVDKEEFLRNYDAFHKTATDGEKFMVKFWFDMRKREDGKLPKNQSYGCLAFLHRPCEWDNEPRTLEELEAAVGAGLRSVQDKKIGPPDIRPIFEGRDLDGNGKLSFSEVMMPYYKIQEEAERSNEISAEKMSKGTDYVGAVEYLVVNKAHLLNRMGKEMTFGQWAQYVYKVTLNGED